MRPPVLVAAGYTPSGFRTVEQAAALACVTGRPLEIVLPTPSVLWSVAMIPMAPPGPLWEEPSAVADLARLLDGYGTTWRVRFVDVPLAAVPALVRTTGATTVLLDGHCGQWSPMRPVREGMARWVQWRCGVPVRLVGSYSRTRQNFDLAGDDGGPAPT